MKKKSSSINKQKIILARYGINCTEQIVCSKKGGVQAIRPLTWNVNIYYGQTCVVGLS